MLSKLFVRVLASFHREEGQDLIEYALITAVLSLGIIAVIAVAGIPGAFGGWASDIVAEINPT
jgi:Flp pilus assembly pilin Flp